MSEEKQFPTIIHLGMQRSGSTFLYSLLKNHPQLSLSPRQEIHYYSRHWDAGLDWYFSQFDDRGIRVDTSPKYFLQASRIAPRIHETAERFGKVCDMRFILILRNPIDYVYAHYQFHMHTGMFRKHPLKYPDFPHSFGKLFQRYPQYFRRGNYDVYLQEFLRYFDRKQFVICPFERFIQHSEQTISDILRHCELEVIPLRAARHAQNAIPRNKLLKKVRKFFVRHSSMKERLKKSRLLGKIYPFLIKKYPKLSSEQRMIYRAFYHESVAALKKQGIETGFWEDFS